jgi:hypothetical protein
MTAPSEPFYSYVFIITRWFSLPCGCHSIHSHVTLLLRFPVKVWRSLTDESFWYSIVYFENTCFLSHKTNFFLHFGYRLLFGIDVKYLLWHFGESVGPYQFVISSVNWWKGSQGCSVSILVVSDYGLDDRATKVRSPAEAKDISSSLCV